MMKEASRDFRVAVIAALVRRSNRGLGRTGLMKLSYLLQTLKNVPLGYSFRLYTYGPYEAQVLEDLKVAEIKGAVKSTVKGYPAGYGYEITPGENADRIIDVARDDLAPHAATLDWVLEQFGDRTAIDLEMVSTIIYVDQASQASGEAMIISDMATRVHAIKPRLDLARIESEARSLLAKGLLMAAH